MPFQNCLKHQQLEDFICAKNQCNQLLCSECFKVHSEVHQHPQAVKLSIDSREFFLRWTHYILSKIQSFCLIVTLQGYSKLFEMKLDPGHPKGTVGQLDFQQIEKAAIQALEQHKRVTEGNLVFIKNTQTVDELIHPQFLKDLYNIVCHDAKYNMENLITNISKRLAQNHPEKEIYSFSKFNVIPKQILQIEEERKKLVTEFQEKIILKILRPKVLSPFKINSKSAIFLENEDQNHHEVVTSPRNTRDYLQKKQELLINSKSQLNQHRLRPFSPKFSGQTSSLINQNIGEQKVSIEQLKMTISLLKSNQITYQQKIAVLQNRSVLLKNQVERMTLFQIRIKQLQRLNDSKNKAKSLRDQFQSQLKRQIQQMQNTQSHLTDQNRILKESLKEFKLAAESRSTHIISLQQQMQKMVQNIKLKQKSIQQLNKLISNEQQQINYRENEVQILGQEIKKLLDKIAFLQRSIHQLNSLVSNEEEQISYRQNQVQILEEEIKKLLKKIQELQNSVKSLNQLIANQEEQIFYRQNESEILQKQVKKLLNKITTLENTIRSLINALNNQEREIVSRENQSEILANQIFELINKNKKLEEKLNYETQKRIQLQSEFQLEVSRYSNIVNSLQNNLAQTNQNFYNIEEQLRSKIARNQQLQDQLASIQEQGTETESSILAQVDQNRLLSNNLKIEEAKNNVLEQQLQLLSERYRLLIEEINSAHQKINLQDDLLKQQTSLNYSSSNEVNNLKESLLSTKAQLNLTQEQLNQLKAKLAQNQLKQPNEQLLEQVVVLEAQMKRKTFDINLLIFIIKELYSKIDCSENQSLIKMLSELQTIDFQAEKQG